VVDEDRHAGVAVAGVGPWRLALRRLRANRVALAFGALFAVLVALALAAPLWGDLAGTSPSRNHLSDTIVIDGQRRDVVTEDRVPIGPTWRAKVLPRRRRQRP